MAKRGPGLTRLPVVGILICLAYLVLAALFQFLGVYPFSLWPATAVAALCIGWLTLASWLRRRYRHLVWFGYVTFLIQALLITAMVHWVGGIHSLLPVLHIFNVAAATYVLGLTGGWAIAGASLLFLGSVWLLESTGALALYAIWSANPAPDQTGVVMANLAFTAIPVLFTVAVVGVVLGELRQRRQTVVEYRHKAEAQLAALRQAESQIRLETGRLEAILRSTHEGIMLYDTGGKLVYSNPVVEQILEPPEPPVLGDADGITASGSLSRQLRSELQAASRNPRETTHRVISMEGQRQRHVAVDSSPVTNREGRLIGRLLILRDTTDQKELEFARDEWIRMLVHDLRSPLMGVLGNLELAQDLLRRGERHEAVVEMVETAHTSGRDLLDIVNSLLDVSKLEAGKGALEQAPISLPELMDRVVQEVEPLAKIARLDLQLDLPTDLPMVTGDRDKLHRVLVNLLDNAIKFSPDGGMVTVQAAQNGESVRVSVTDTGPGIPPDQRLAVFDRFAQLSGVEARRVGTGLGLTFCKLVVEAHGGRIWVEGSPEGGSRFVFTLPLEASSSAGLQPESVAT